MIQAGPNRWLTSALSAFSIIQSPASAISEDGLAQISDITGREALLCAVEALLGHQFRSQKLLLQALTHSSYSNESAFDAGETQGRIPDNERLEFLGDAVIGLVVASRLMEMFPGACEGNLSRWRSSLVSRKTLAELAYDMRLGDFLLLGRGERRTGGAEKRSILAAALEALVGALYIDGGLERAMAFLGKVYEAQLLAMSNGHDISFRALDRKTHLQERTQRVFKSTPIYRMVDSWGAEHEKHFQVEIVIGGDVVATGDGRSKKEAEQHAAELALEKLGL